MKKQSAAKAAAQAQERRQACHEVRDRLQQMQNGGFVWYELDADGERVYLDETSVQNRITALREREQAVCG